MGEFKKINELCIGCRRCTEVCPGKIDIPGLIEELRVRSLKEHGLPFVLRTVFENVFANRRVFHGLLRLAAIGQKPFQSGSLIRHLPLFWAGLARDRSLPAITSKPLRDRIPQIVRKIPRPVQRVAFFSGCTIDFVFPETGESVFKVLQNLDMEVVFPEKQSCCGKPVSATGDMETARRIARRNLEAFEDAAADVILAACPACTEALRGYAEILKEDDALREKAEKFAGRVREFCEFVAREYERTGRLTPAAGKGKVTYHDSCHMKRVLEISREPRQLLAAAGYELVEMKDCDKCCGMSGAFGLKYAELSLPILRQKIQNIQANGAEIVTVACSGCMVQIQGGLDKQAPGIKMMHVADILAESIK